MFSPVQESFGGLNHWGAQANRRSVFLRCHGDECIGLIESDLRDAPKVIQLGLRWADRADASRVRKDQHDRLAAKHILEYFRIQGSSSSEASERDDAKCKSLGLKAGTEDYRICRNRLQTYGTHEPLL